MPKATLALINANVITLNPKQPRTDAIAIWDDKIAAVGTNQEIQKDIDTKTKVIDAEGKTIIPGLVDCHVHMKGLGNLLQTLDLTNTKSIPEMQQKIREYNQEHPEKKWILGRRWEQDKFPQRLYPTSQDLDAATTEKPVFLLRVCGHIGIANTKALQLAGITRKTQVNGGKIDLDPATGQPNGILRENALDLIWKVIPKPSPQQLQQTCLLACRRAVEAGLTAVHWLTSSTEEIRTIQRLHFQRKLPIRAYLGIPVELLDEITNLGLLTGFGNPKVKIGFIKILADGSLGGHTAALKQPYTDKPETEGMMLYTPKRLSTLISKAHKAGLQLAVHAIGDQTIETVLEIFQKVLGKCPREDHRHRIEHCSLLNPELVKQMRSLELIASVQPHFIVSDFWVSDRLGLKRARWMHPFKTLEKQGLIVASGSDCPVEPIDPLLGIWAAVTREYPREERLTLEEALETYTSNAAYASFDEEQKGTIEPGKLADLTVLSDDILNIPPDEIRTIRVEMTIVDGKIVYQRNT